MTWLWWLLAVPLALAVDAVLAREPEPERRLINPRTIRPPSSPSGVVAPEIPPGSTAIHTAEPADASPSWSTAVQPKPR